MRLAISASCHAAAIAARASRTASAVSASAACSRWRDASARRSHVGSINGHAQDDPDVVVGDDWCPAVAGRERPAVWRRAAGAAIDGAGGVERRSRLRLEPSCLGPLREHACVRLAERAVKFRRGEGAPSMGATSSPPAIPRRAELGVVDCRRRCEHGSRHVQGSARSCQAGLVARHVGFGARRLASAAGGPARTFAFADSHARRRARARPAMPPRPPRRRGPRSKPARRRSRRRALRRLSGSARPPRQAPPRRSPRRRGRSRRAAGARRWRPSSRRMGIEAWVSSIAVPPTRGMSTVGTPILRRGAVVRRRADDLGESSHAREPLPARDFRVTPRCREPKARRGEPRVIRAGVLDCLLEGHCSRRLIERLRRDGLCTSGRRYQNEHAHERACESSRDGAGHRRPVPSTLRASRIAWRRAHREPCAVGISPRSIRNPSA